jgi:protein SCO1/2
MSLRRPEEIRPRSSAAHRDKVRHRWGLILAGIVLVSLAGCSDHEQWHNTNVTGAMPQLSFTMTRANDGKQVTAADYRGKVVLLYFGYTYCPDVCPTTMTTVAAVLRKLKAKADQVRVLFVTVDPNRDMLDVLKHYTVLFASQVDGLRGTPDQLTALARRYRVSYSVTPATKGQPYEVTHSSAIYVFDKTGATRLLLSSLGKGMPDIDGIVADLERLID